jgi:hypothetical protein
MQKDGKFNLRKGLSSLVSSETGQLITVEDKVIITLYNKEIVSGMLTFVSESCVIVRTSDYEYGETGVVYQQTLLLIKDIDLIDSSGHCDEAINWRFYSNGLTGIEEASK